MLLLCLDTKEQRQKEAAFFGSSLLRDKKMEYKALSANEFESCRELLNAFYGTKHFLNCCSFANCEETAEEFTELYRNHPKALESCIIALDTNNVVCGCIRLSIDEIPRSKADDFLHVPEKDECYVSTVCVSERARGKGVGTRLLEEAETFARKYQKTRLGLEVLNGNPAERLYRRFGFEPVEETGAAWCVASCLSCVFLGKREHGKFGRVKMEKTLTYDNTTL